MSSTEHSFDLQQKIRIQFHLQLLLVAFIYLFVYKKNQTAATKQWYLYKSQVAHGANTGSAQKATNYTVGFGNSSVVTLTGDKIQSSENKEMNTCICISKLSSGGDYKNKSCYTHSWRKTYKFWNKIKSKSTNSN